MYVSVFSCTPVASIYCNQRGAFWVQMCPAVRTQTHDISIQMKRKELTDIYDGF